MQPSFWLLSTIGLIFLIIRETQGVEFWCPCVRNPTPRLNDDRCQTGDEYNQFWCNNTNVAFGSSPPINVVPASGRPGIKNGEFLFYCLNAPCYSPAQPERVHKATVLPGEMAGFYFVFRQGQQFSRNSGTSLPPGRLSGNMDEFEFYPNANSWSTIARKCNTNGSIELYQNIYWYMNVPAVAQIQLVVDLRVENSTAAGC